MAIETQATAPKPTNGNQTFDEEIVEELEAEDATLGRATFNMAATETCDANDR